MVKGNVAFRDYQAKRPELNWWNSSWKMVFVVRKVNCFVNSTYKMLVKLFTCSQFKADGVSPTPPPPTFTLFLDGQKMLETNVVPLALMTLMMDQRINPAVFVVMLNP